MADEILGREPKGWSLLTVDPSERSFQGNDGYDDDLSGHYSYDSEVSNSGHVTPGDFVVLRDKKFLLGAACVEEVRRREGTKLRKRCPSCRSTKFNSRRTRSPRYHCPRCQAQFHDVLVEDVAVTRYVARYASTWRPFDRAVPANVLEPAYQARAVQNAIRELRLDAVRSLLMLDIDSGWWTYTATIAGGRSQGVVWRRVGQQRFRAEMLLRFGARCAVSGPSPAEALEAAHLYSYAKQPEHLLDGGLMLRRDLHALFDRGLLLIDPDNGWCVEFAPELKDYPALAALDGTPIDVPDALLPSPGPLREHAARARESWHLRGRHRADELPPVWRT